MEGRWLGSGAGTSGALGMILGRFEQWKGGEGLLGFWVSLGKEMEEIWRTGRGSEGRRKLLISDGRRRRILLALTLSLVPSSISKKVNEERRRCWLYRDGTGATRAGILKSHQCKDCSSIGEENGETIGN